MSKPGRRTVPEDGYWDYIQSAEWRAVRERFLQSRLPKECFGCREKWRKGFHLHHRTYKHLGAEKLGHDVVPMCPDCHETIHRLNRGWVIDIWTATKKIRHYGSKGETPEAARQNIRRVAEILMEKKPRRPPKA